MKQRTRTAEHLPDELLWADGGHASDVVLTAMADGQVEIVPDAALAHVNGCVACTTHLGNAALLSLHAGRELALLGPDLGLAPISAIKERATTPAAAAEPFPRLAVVLGLVFAVLGLVPSLVDAPRSLGGLRSFATHDVPLLASGLRTLVQELLGPGSKSGVILMYGASALLILMAVAVVRLLPKKEVS
ncbi:MAG: hypothetical protein JWP97_5068 [Labilithrix sp.]|nr:hypothetical protein [Labilithrix sp.]